MNIILLLKSAGLALGILGLVGTVVVSFIWCVTVWGWVGVVCYIAIAIFLWLTGFIYAQES